MRKAETIQGFTLAGFSISILHRGMMHTPTAIPTYVLLIRHPYITMMCGFVGLMVSACAIVNWHLGRRLFNLIALLASGWLIYKMVQAFGLSSPVMAFAVGGMAHHITTAYGMRDRD